MTLIALYGMQLNNISKYFILNKNKNNFESELIAVRFENIFLQLHCTSSSAA